MEMVKIPKDEYEELKKKAEVNDDLLKQLRDSISDVKSGRIKRVV